MVPKFASSLFVSLFLAAAFAGCNASSKDGGVNQDPTASMEITAGDSPRTFTFDASGSKDPDGDALTYLWNYTVGMSTEPKFTVTFPPSIGNATLAVTLLVKDSKGGFDALFDVNKTVLGSGKNTAPSVNILDTIRWVPVGTGVKLDAAPTTDPDGDPVSFEWFFGPRGLYDPMLSGPADPIVTPDNSSQTFNSALMNPGQSASHAFDQPGVYTFGCHPHPWMVGRLIVDASRPSDGNAEIDMQGYRFTNDTLTVGLGTNVTFRNLDHDRHTASVLDYVAGTELASTSSVLDKTPPAGEYVARLFAHDSKGAMATATWGVKVSADAPTFEVKPTTFSADPTDPNDVAIATRHANTTTFKVAFDTGVQKAVLTWADSPVMPQIQGNFTLIRTQSGAIGRESCPFVRSGNTATLGPCKIPANAAVDDEYSFDLSADTNGHPMANWTITLTAVQFTKPPFGDFNALRCHYHIMNGAPMMMCH